MPKYWYSALRYPNDPKLTRESSRLKFHHFLSPRARAPSPSAGNRVVAGALEPVRRPPCRAGPLRCPLVAFAGRSATPPAPTSSAALKPKDLRRLGRCSPRPAPRGPRPRMRRPLPPPPAAPSCRPSSSPRSRFAAPIPPVPAVPVLPQSPTRPPHAPRRLCPAPVAACALPTVPRRHALPTVPRCCRAPPRPSCAPPPSLPPSAAARDHHRPPLASPLTPPPMGIEEGRWGLEIGRGEKEGRRRD